MIQLLLLLTAADEQYWNDACTPKVVGQNLEVAGNDLIQTSTPSSQECATSCCANQKCAGALFEPISAVTYGGCKKGAPCCFMKTSTATPVPMKPPVQGGSTLWTIPTRSQDPEKLTFLSATLGDHMVLQRAPASAVVWGFTSPGATVTTTMQPSSKALGGGSSGMAAPMQTFTTKAGADGTWRQSLPATKASSQHAYDFAFASSSAAAEKATMTDVLFGDVYICGGQSNMEFGMPAVANRTIEQQDANNFPNIRFFSVGHRTQSAIPFRNLQSLWEPWQVASNLTINKDFGPGHTLFSTFSAVCWLYGKELSKNLGPDVPLGLISNNWGGTKVEVWTPKEAYAKCNRTDAAVDGPMYNAMILPYAEGPMQVAGFTWYQGEANTQNATSAEQYACMFPQMIDAWRAAFAQPTAFFGFVQLSTWCALPPDSLPQMREAQMAALALPNVGYATNADHGMGCSIHPAEKQHIGKRLADVALGIVYKSGVQWKSPTYKSAKQTAMGVGDHGRSGSGATVALEIALNDVSSRGLYTIYPYNYYSEGYGSHATQVPTIVDCTSTFPSGPAQNTSMETQCAWAALQISGSNAWLNATVTVSADSESMVLTADVPAHLVPGAGVSAASRADGAAVSVVASAYGWGPIPMMSVYDTDTELPVLPWNTSVSF